MNHADRIVIFGAWDTSTEGDTSLILDQKWERAASGRKNSGFAEALEYVQMVENEGYRLQTFPMIYSERKKDEQGRSSGAIQEFIPQLTEKKLRRVGGMWYASSETLSNSIPEEIAEPNRFFEGAAKSIYVNAYERNANARTACIRHYGTRCFVCGFDFEATYGPIGSDFIHVHHLLSLAKIGREYEVDPINDLRPVCPNCHAIIHRTQPALEIEQLKEHLARAKDA